MPKLSFDVFTRDNASAGLEKIGAKVGSVAGVTASVTAKAAEGLANLGRKVVDFARESVDVAISSEESTNRLAWAWGNFANTADVSVDSILAMADALREQAGISAGATKESAALLAQFDLTGQQILTLLPLIADYSRITGTDMYASTEAIGKALYGQGRALKSVGIDFENQGTAAENYGYVVDQLTEKVGGYASAWGDTTAGEMAKADAEMKKVKSTIGAELLPIVKELFPYIIEALQRVTVRVAQFHYGLERIGDAFASMGDAWEWVENKIGSGMQWLADQMARVNGWIEKLSFGLLHLPGLPKDLRDSAAAAGAGASSASSGRAGAPIVYNVNVTSPFGISPADAGAQIVAAIQQFERRNTARWRSGDTDPDV